MTKPGTVISSIVCLTCLAAFLHAADQPQWGQRHSRNMVSDEKGLADDFSAGTKKPNSKEIDLSTTRNVKWVVKTGSETFGGPVVAGGKVFIGTNNSYPRDARHRGDRGVLMCFEEATGKFLWQLVVPKLTTIQNADWHYVGIASPPTVEGKRLYVVSNRGEVLCLDTEGMANGNDGAFKDEDKHMAKPGEPPIEPGPGDGDIIWCYDMVGRLGVSPHNASNCSILLDGDLLYVCTSNGVEWTHQQVPSTEAPTLIVLDKKTGALVARDNERIAPGIAHGQWCSPTMGKVNGRALVFFGAGNGVCYAFEPAAAPAGGSGAAFLKKVWSFTCYPSDPHPTDSLPPKDRPRTEINCIYSSPVLHNNRVYVAGGKDIWHGGPGGRLFCIDAAKTGDITQAGPVWSYETGRCISTVSMADGLLYIAGEDGRVHCLDGDTGRAYWVHQTRGPIWGGTLVADSKVYVGNGRGEFWILAAGKEKKVINKIEVSPGVCNVAVAANGVLYVASQEHLYAIAPAAQPGK